MIHSHGLSGYRRTLAGSPQLTSSQQLLHSVKYGLTAHVLVPGDCAKVAALVLIVEKL